MEAINDFSPLALAKQAAKDKKQQRYYQNNQAKKGTKKQSIQTAKLNSNNKVEVERRSGIDRRTLKQKQKRFDLRTKYDRRKSSTVSLKI